MGKLYLIRHPATSVDEGLPPDEWPLSDEGDRQLAAILRQPLWQEVRHVHASTEAKAAVVARRAAEVHRIGFSLHDDLKELRRTAFVAGYEAVVERVFAAPTEEVSGWESLAAASDRVWGFISQIAARGPMPAAVVSHGLVLAALRARLLSHRAPTLAEWRQLPFGGIAELEASDWRFLKEFALPCTGM